MPSDPKDLRELQELLRRAGDLRGPLLKKFLRNLGPFGKAIALLIDTSADTRDVLSALQSLGLKGRGGSRAAPEPSSRTKPDRPANKPEPPTEEQELPRGQFVQRKAIEMEHVVGSSNVYAIGYDADTMTMRVQYLGTSVKQSGIRGRTHAGKNRLRGRLGGTLSGTRKGPGPVYDYHGVPQSVFNRVQRAASKGTAIWDNLRIRGTVYGHQYDYQLAAASMVEVVSAAGKAVAKLTYVPRKAVGRGQFKARTQKQGSSVFKSILPSVGMRRRG